MICNAESWEWPIPWASLGNCVRSSPINRPLVSKHRSSPAETFMPDDWLVLLCRLASSRIMGANRVSDVYESLAIVFHLLRVSSLVAIADIKNCSWLSPLCATCLFAGVQLNSLL